MFGGGQANSYDEIVVKATDENLTGENWEIILNLCDKVQDEGEEGARNVVASLLKRLAHRNPNVQLYALSLAESLSKNCGKILHREIASKAFTQGLERLVTDRTTHDKVRKRTLVLIAEWAAEFEDDETLGIMEESYNNLRSKNYKFDQPSEPPPPAVDDEIRRKEEEELQRVLELSMQDKGGRPGWAEAYSPAASSTTAGGGASSTDAATGSGSGAGGYQSTKYTGGYTPASVPARERTPSPGVQTSAGSSTSGYHAGAGAGTGPAVVPTGVPFATGASAASAVGAEPSASHAAPAAISSHESASSSSAGDTTSSSGIVTRVLALHTFNPTEPGELAFEKGDIIKVVDRGYKDWWRGQVRGRTGIFPVNYVEPLPEPTPAEIAREAEAEAAVFSQAVNVERLLNMLRAMDPERDSLADNEDIQELYRSCMALRPKIVKLIDKYSQKRADLVSMNETFVRARTIFDRMMEESLARHTGVYDTQPPFRPHPPPQSSYSPYQPPDSRGQGHPEYGPSPPPGPWGPHQPHQAQQLPGYGPVPPPQGFRAPQAAAYLGAEGAYGTGPQGQQAYAPPPQQGPYQQQPIQPQQQPVQQSSQGQVPQQVLQQGVQPQVVGQTQTQTPPQPQQQAPQTAAGPVYGTQAGYAVNQQQPYGTQGLVIYPEQGQQQGQGQAGQAGMSPQQQQGQGHSPQEQTQPLQPLQTLQAQVQPQPQQVQPQVQTQPQQQQPQPQSQAPAQSQPQLQPQQGPPYIYDPAATYADPNVQAWAQYYSKGGKDPQGAVYFFSVPGVKEGPGAATAAAAATTTENLNQGGQSGQSQPQHSVQQQQQQPTPVSRNSTIDSLPYPGDYAPAASPQATSPGGAGAASRLSFSANTFGVTPGAGAFTTEPQQQDEHPYSQGQGQGQGQGQQHHGFGRGYQLQDSGRAATSQSSLPLPGAGGATSQSSLPLPGVGSSESSHAGAGGSGTTTGLMQPSWLLPKREAAGHGHSVQGGLASQFAGSHVSGSGGPETDGGDGIL